MGIRAYRLNHARDRKHSLHQEEEPTFRIEWSKFYKYLLSQKKTCVLDVNENGCGIIMVHIDTLRKWIKKCPDWGVELNERLKQDIKETEGESLKYVIYSVW